MEQNFLENKPPNLLLPSAGKKAFLARMLAEAVERRGGALIAADMDPEAPALEAAHIAVVLPSMDDPDFLPAVNDLILTHDISAVIPARDPELEWWALRHEEGELEATVFSSPSATLRTCLDKLQLCRVATDAGVPCPDTRPYEGCGQPPFFLKPRFGAGSRGARLIKTGEAMPSPDEDLLAQEYVEGPEYTVDCYALESGELAATVVRERITVVDGQSAVGQTVSDEELQGLCKKLAGTLRFRGAVNMQFIRGKQGPRLIDVNPRFSGGIAITKAAGIDFAEWTIRELCGEPLDIQPSYKLVLWSDQGL